MDRAASSLILVAKTMSFVQCGCKRRGFRALVRAAKEPDKPLRVPHLRDAILGDT